jgi:hypothetical protein
MPGESPLSMMQPPERRARRPYPIRARRGRSWPVVATLAALAAIIVLAMLWTGLWYYSASMADRALAGWVEREAAAGRVYSCGSQTIGGFPLSIRANCADATAEIKNSEPPYTVAAKDIHFVAEVYDPTRLIGDITGPLTLAPLGQSPSLSATWTRAQIIVSGVPPNPDKVSIELGAPHLDRVGGGETIFKAKNADLRGRITAGSPQDHPVIELTLRLSEATAPAFNAMLAEPTEAEFDAVVRGFNDLSPKPWADRFRKMQAAGGGIDIKSLHVVQADAIIVGTGTLSIGSNGKLNGLIRVAIAGIEHLVPRLGIDRLIGQGLDQLSGGNGGLDRLVPGLSETLRATANAGVIDNLKKMGQPTSIGNQPAIVLPLRFSDGAIYLGMLRLGEAPPLF